MNQEELDALLVEIAPNRDPRRLVFVRGTKQIKVTKPPTRVGGNPTEETIEVPVLKWTDPGTGMVLEVEGTETGAFRVVQQGIDQRAQGQPAVTPAQQQAAEDAANKPAEPPKERVNPEDPKRRQKWDPKANNGAGEWVDAGIVAQETKPSEPPKERVDPANSTRRQRWEPTANDGKGDWVDAGAVEGKPAEPPKERVNPEDPSRRQRWEPTQNDGKGAWVDAGAVASGAPLPENAPKFTPDVTKSGLGISEYVAAVRARTDLTKAQQDELIKEAHAMATGEATRINAILGVQEGEANRGVTQRGQDVSLSTNRLSNAISSFGTAVSGAGELGKYSSPSAILPYLMALAHAQGSAFGGLNDIPRAPSGPAIQQINGLGITGPSPIGAPPAWQQPASPPVAAPALAAPPEVPSVFNGPLPTGATVNPAPTEMVPGEPAGGEPPDMQRMPLGAGPWGANPAMQQGMPQAAPGMGVDPMMMAAQQAIANYDPRGLNAQLLQDGFDPEVIQMLGGVG